MMEINTVEREHSIQMNRNDRLSFDVIMPTLLVRNEKVME